jgi:hypothetical protein
MKKFHLILYLFVFLIHGCKQDPYQYNLQNIRTENLKIPPEYYTIKPILPSPAISEAGRELVLIKIGDDYYTWIDATVENGEPFDYKRNLYGKGNQQMADKDDFPGLARRGIHQETELRNTKILTGRSVSRITIDARPNGSSGVGFIADDETIMSVILADNGTVRSLGLTHPDMARPLFHIWNISREYENYITDTITHDLLQLNALLYNGHEVRIKIAGSRGWQESIFNDEILGSGHIEIWREMKMEELEFLKKNYKHLSEEQFEKLLKMLSFIHTGEMVFFYIIRYGFYEGHTEYRVDPITIAFVFGLKSIEDVHLACGGDLYNYFIQHFTKNPE